LVAIRDSFPERSLGLQTVVIAVMGAAGVAIGGLQLKGATGVAAGVAVFFAITRLPLRAGVALAGAITVALAVVTAIAGSSSSSVAAEVLVTVLLGVVAQFLKRSRESQDRVRNRPRLAAGTPRWVPLCGLASILTGAGAAHGGAGHKASGMAMAGMGAAVALTAARER
jgi:hypothetical protein